jgi:hypothetical protein
MTYTKMKTLISLAVLLTSATTLWGQGIPNEKSRFMTHDQNQNWLKTIKPSDKATQWTEIKERYFNEGNWNVRYDSIQYSPIILVNGVPYLVPDSVTSEYCEMILKLLNTNSISEINIIDKLSDDWVICTPFAGAILLSIDKKTSKKLFNLKS